jgi:hypothetical protein
VDHEFSVSELNPDHLPAVVALCREALDLPEDAGEAEEIVRRLTAPGAAPAVPRVSSRSRTARSSARSSAPPRSVIPPSATSTWSPYTLGTGGAAWGARC